MHQRQHRFSVFGMLVVQRAQGANGCAVAQAKHIRGIGIIGKFDRLVVLKAHIRVAAIRQILLHAFQGARQPSLIHLITQLPRFQPKLSNIRRELGVHPAVLAPHIEVPERRLCG